jgi:hypothetical protein
MENMEETYLITIRLAFLPCFPYHFTIFFCIFQILSLFNLGFFHIFHIFSLFNLPFFHIFPIFSLFNLPNISENTVDENYYCNRRGRPREHPRALPITHARCHIFQGKPSGHYSTYLSFIFSLSFHYSTYFSSVFPNRFTIQLTFLPYFPYLFTI